MITKHQLETYTLYGAIGRVLILLTIHNLNLPIKIKFPLLLFSDICDTEITRYFTKSETYLDAHTPLYQILDKLLDLLTYLVVWNLVKNKLTKSETYIIFGTILLRLIGVLAYISKNKEEIYMYFPDLTRETLIFFALSFTISPLLFVVWFGKIIFEYYWHYKMLN